MKHPVLLMLGTPAAFVGSILLGAEVQYIVLLLTLGIFFGVLTLKKPTSVNLERHSRY